MLYRIIGPAGSGKTEYLLKAMGRAFSAGKRCVLIVPEQQSVDYESLLCERFGDGSNLICETLNFQRLPNRVAREYGGLALNSIDKGGACALLSLTAEELKPRLKEYNAVASDADFASELLALYTRMQTSMITPEMLSAAADDPIVKENSALSQRLSEISLILNNYVANFGEGLNDPRDALTKLAQELPQKPFFKGITVFIDGYYNFTLQEHAVIDRIAEQSENLYISFTLDGSRRFFSENKKSFERVVKDKRLKSEDIWLDGRPRGKKGSLRKIESDIWRSPVEPLRGDDGGLKLISAANRFDECSAAASEILDFVRAGNRWRDVCVLAGNAENYIGLIDPVFARAGIPCYVSAGKGISNHPLAAFILSSLAVVSEDFSLRSVKRYIKSGYSGLTVSESDILLGYAESWNIRGKGWYGESEWIMDPEGYREGDLTPRGAAILQIASSARRKAIPPLSAFRETVGKKEFSVAEGVRAVYDHMIACGCDEKLRRSAERMLISGDREGSDREIGLWKLMMNALDQLYNVCGQKTVNAKRLQSLLRLVFESYSPGAIPALADSVTFGDASMTRAGNKKLVIVLGVCDGEFPAAASSGIFFDRDEASILESAGIEIADTTEKALDTSRFLVYSAFSAPTEKLVVSCPKNEITGEQLRRSSAFLSLGAMFPDVKTVDYDSENTFSTREGVAAAFPFLAEGELREKIGKALFDKREPFYEKPPAVVDRRSRIEYPGDTLMLSPSRFERYALCPFSFFGSYLLGLKEKKQNDWATPEIGNFIHNILEKFMRSCVSQGKFKLPGDGERVALVRELSKKYFLDVIGEKNAEDKRFLHTYDTMIRTLDSVTADLCAEFAESKFIPVGFEFRIGLKDADMPAVSYDSEGKRVLLRGSIDRVDTYVKNGVTYVRVIDYKTYNKTFKASLVEYGLDTQMLHYLFAYCRCKQALPAGVLYYTIALPFSELTGNESEPELTALAEKTLKREGILLDDPDIVFAMSESCEFVPVARKKDGTISDRGNRLRSAEQFKELGIILEEGVKKLSKEVFAGNMDIAPNEIPGGDDPCKYCKLAGFCRAANKPKEETDETD